MGAKQRAQARSKNTKSSKGSMKGSPWSQKQSSSSLSVRNLDPSGRSHALKGWNDLVASGLSFRNDFTMTQEARNTERHTFGWGTSRLRDNAVSFVSAGTLTREEPQSSSTEEKDKDVKREEDQSQREVVSRPSDGFQSEEHTQEHPQSIEISTQKDLNDPLSALEITSLPHSTAEQEKDLHSGSSSEGEEILFHGRGTPAPKPVSQAENPNPAPLNGHSRSADTAVPLMQPAGIPLRSQRLQQGPMASSAEGHSSWTPKRNRAGRLGKQRRNRHIPVSDEEDAIIQDYIANMAVDDEDEDDDEEPSTNKSQRRNETFRFYDGAGEEHVKVQTKSKLSKQPAAYHVDEVADWDSADLEDFDDLATTDEDIDDIAQVLRHRERPSGAQYLVTAIGKGASDAKWMLQSKLTSSTAMEEIRTYHEILTMRIEVGDDDTDSSSGGEDDDALDDLIDEIESEDDENAQIIARTARMSDAQIARALAKQEELGMGSDELVLFDGQEEGVEDAVDDRLKSGSNFVPFSLSQHTSNRTRSKANRRQRDSFPSAEAFADALDQDPYGGFDVMDFDRPSVRPKRKGKKNDFAFNLELSDDDLAQSIKSTWLKDREKKARRKQDKMEALEAQLLESAGRNHPAAIKAEIRRFLIDETETLELAPMDSHIRASVHRLAKSLKLKSQSQGKEGRGAGRYPVLTKTEHTPHYTIDTIYQIDALMEQRKFFPKHPSKSFRSLKSTTAARRARGGGGIADASLRSGDVVGSWAPELGADNKGRAMLEKMGWKSGTGIGAVGNEGSLEHVKQVVKRDKAGLG